VISPGTCRRINQSIRFSSLPMNRILFLSNDSLVGAGHDFNPLLFSADGSGFWCVSLP
jgi:hypothetical protein